jgi:hypothetical protein
MHIARGSYSFLRGGAAYSAGVVANEGHEIVHASFAQTKPLRAGFEAIAQHLAALGIPKVALCAIQLRLPEPLTAEGFRDFNKGYVELLKSWDIFADGLNPVARTNVAPVVFPPSEPGIHAFSYVAPATNAPPTFIAAGAGEIADGATIPDDIVRRGETSADAMAEKARFVMAEMDARLSGLGGSWPDVTVITVYTARDLHSALMTDLLKPTSHNAITWHYARPPIAGLEFEVDVRGVRREIVLA